LWLEESGSKGQQGGSKEGSKGSKEAAGQQGERQGRKVLAVDSPRFGRTKYHTEIKRQIFRGRNNREGMYRFS
jgi:hypothetical protein